MTNPALATKFKVEIEINGRFEAVGPNGGEIFDEAGALAEIEYSEGQGEVVRVVEVG